MHTEWTESGDIDGDEWGKEAARGGGLTLNATRERGGQSGSLRRTRSRPGKGYVAEGVEWARGGGTASRLSSDR